MKSVIVSIYDIASNLFSRPAFVQSTGAAIRGFGDEVRRVDPGNDLNKHPSDFDLYTLGTFDDDTGELFPAKPERISRAVDHITSV